MDNSKKKLEAELKKLGFYYIDENTVEGNVPNEGTINDVSILVNINTKNFPYKSPTVQLISINGEKDLYKKTPKYWKHIDELIVSDDPTKSLMTICCLHNWQVQPGYNGEFIYNRIVDWLQHNTAGSWIPEAEVQGWRLTPPLSSSKLYIADQLTKEIKINTPHDVEMVHPLYQLKNGKEISGQKQGTVYPLDEINFKQPKKYEFFPVKKGGPVIDKLWFLQFQERYVSSTFTVIKLPSSFSFTTFHQLLECIRSNFNLKELANGKMNVPFLILYRGALDQLEAISFIADRSYIEGKKEFKAQPLKVESIPSRPISIPLKVGLIGVGSLGSQLARILTDKQTKEIIFYDPDNFSADNLGHHELDGRSLNRLKSENLATALYVKSIDTSISVKARAQEVYDHADLLVVTVGSTKEYHALAFQELVGYSKPILWAWVSPYNVLQEVVITTPTTGCLNCYYLLSEDDPTLKKFNEQEKEELKHVPAYTYDFCGQPHTISDWEKNVFFATQLTSIIASYGQTGNFKFNYYAFYWGINDILSTSTMGNLVRHSKCSC